MYQTWQAVLMRIHDELGSGNTKLEITDRQIIETIQLQVMPIFSSYSDNNRFYKMTQSHLISSNPVLQYKFEDDMEFGISEIKAIIMDQSATRLDIQFMNDVYTNSGDITDYLVKQNYLQMSEMTIAPNTWKFVRPDIIQIRKGASNYSEDLGFIVEYGAVHKSPETIDSGMWQEFLDLALAYIMVKVGKIRKKFDNFTTPFGQVVLNADELIQEGNLLKQNVLDRLNRTPSSDQLVYFL